jgi:hypothetical protein
MGCHNKITNFLIQYITFTSEVQGNVFPSDTTK